jgi:hypothetical protein
MKSPQMSCMRGCLLKDYSRKNFPQFSLQKSFLDTIPHRLMREKQDGYGFIFLESMRDINIPRPLGIPNPMAYQRLCACLRDNWEAIKNHFKTKTNGNTHKISRIHIRKQAKSTKIFNMNYKNWMTDDSPVPNILIGKKYMVSADISTCFPSIYTHSLCWALAGKRKMPKKNRTSKLWFNSLDHKCMELRSGETHGIFNRTSYIKLAVRDYLNGC